MTLQMADGKFMQNRKRPYRTRTSEKNEFTGCTACCYGLLAIACQILLWGAVGLVIFWVYKYHDGFAWHEDPKKEFNLHPVLMISGFIFLMGQAMLVYRTCRCCRRIYNKLWHTILHLLAMPAIAIGIVAAFDSHNLNKNGPIPNLYSLHSWMGVITVGLFALQFIVGFFSFLVLLCCDSKTANYRASLHPIHVHFGLATFLMAVATCVTGLTEKILFTYDVSSPVGNKKYYKDSPTEAYVVNALAMVLVGAGLLMAFIVRYSRFQRVALTSVNERL